MAEKLNEFLNPFVNNFIKSIDEAVYFAGFDRQVILHDNFSKLLMHVQPGFMQHVNSCKRLAVNNLFFSLAIICRSLFDLEITLFWIYNLDIDKKDKAIKVYLNYDGTHPETKKPFYEWQKIIDPNFTCRQTALDLKIDLVGPLIEGGEYISSFDFLSKILHWNPQAIKDILGINEKGIVSYRPVTLCVLTINIALKSISAFILFYVTNFFPNQKDIVDNLMNIRNTFQKDMFILLRSPDI